MKKLILGSLLFAMGMLGVIAMIASATVAFRGAGWLNIWDFLKSGGLLAPFIFFCLMSVTGLLFFIAKPIKKFIVEGMKNSPSFVISND